MAEYKRISILRGVTEKLDFYESRELFFLWVIFVLANPLLAVNDSYRQNALDGARSGRHTAVVRAIEVRELDNFHSLIIRENSQTL